MHFAQKQKATKDLLVVVFLLFRSSVMATHGVWQLKQVTIRYCQHSGSSRFIRCVLSLLALCVTFVCCR